MKKILSIFAAALVAIAVNAQTDFASPGYSCAASDAVLSGSLTAAPSAAPQSSKLCLVMADPAYLAWKDVSTSSPDNAVATWAITATRGCYVSVTLDLGSEVIDSNKHIFEVKIKDDKGNVKGSLAEPAENTDAGKQKTLDGTILIPQAGTYTVELRNTRSYGKGAVLNVILTYAADAPSEIIAVSSVALDKTELALEVAEVEQLAATVLPDNATDPTVTWESTDEAVATVVDGFVTAVAAGTATIKAKAGEKEATCAVTVSAASVPDVDFASACVLSAKKAQTEGAIWKMYTNDAYKLYGEGGHNKKYGNALWTINVTKPCIVSGMLNGMEGGHDYKLDLFFGEDSITTVNQSSATWSSGDKALDGNLTFAKAGEYTLRLRNTQEWSSGKVAGVTLTFEEDLAPAEPKTIYCKVTADWWNWDYSNKTAVGAYAWGEGVAANAEWPGVTMTAVENENGVWSIELDAKYTNIIFTRILPDGTYKGVKTSDLTVPTDEKNMYTITREEFDWSTDKLAETDGEWGVFTPTIITDITYYFVNTPDWAKVYAYAWDPMIKEWPGEEAVLQLGVSKNGHNVWAYTMPSNRRHIIFNDGTSGDGHQTANLDVEEGKPYFYDGTWYATLNDVPTALDNIDAAIKAVKMIENGQMIIIKNGVKYNAQGAIVK